MGKLYGVIGNPIAQSMSPAMHNEEFRHLEIDAHYHPFCILPENLEMAINGMKVLGVEGFNVTIPHKQAIMHLLDKVDPLAEAIGAVNTVVREGGKFIGYNTDGAGYVEAIKKEAKRDFTDSRILIIGAGGAAKAIYCTLLSEGMHHVDICNRTLEKARSLIAESPYKGNSKAIEIQTAEKELSQYELIIQTTSIGMVPDVEGIPISLEQLSEQAFVSDIIYNPYQTRLLQEAKSRGAGIQNGLGMFIYQGALAFEKWTGLKPNTERMKKTVIERLGGTSC